MRIERLKLNEFRNYRALDMQPAPGINLLVGENAQGKTNAVEAIFLCALLRSHRTPRDGELIREGQPGAYVGLDYVGRHGSHEIAVKLRQGESKRLFLDQRQLSRSGELMGQFNVVMFSPEDLTLIKGSPAERRRFLDMEICQLKPAYYYKLQQYNVALKQRNALLKQEGGLKTLFMWDEQLASLGAAIMVERSAFLAKLDPIAAETHAAVTDAREDLELNYRPNIAMDKIGNTSLYEALLAALERGAREDMRRGFTGTGPHRDDIGICLNGTDVRAFGSQGQQRTAALSMKLSEIALIRETKGEPPVLLLDDVLSELDDLRGRLLLERIQDCQTFLTCTSLPDSIRTVKGELQSADSAYTADGPEPKANSQSGWTVWRCVQGRLTPE